MRSVPWITLALVAACSGPKTRVVVTASHPTPENYRCGAYAVRTGEVTPEGEPITMWMPCWDFSKRSEAYGVPADRSTRARLAAAERTQCVGLLPRALERSPFVQDAAIEEIVPHRSGEQIVGAHVVFKEVPGLTPSWMRRAIACHQARWRTLGKPASYLPGDPTLVEGAKVTVTDAGDHLVVRIATESPDAGKIVLDRAHELTVSQSAEAPETSSTGL